MRRVFLFVLLAMFLPQATGAAPGCMYLWGYYDPFHRWLDGAHVMQFAQVVGKNLIFAENGEPDLDSAVKKSDVVIVGRLVAIHDWNLKGSEALSNPFEKVSRIPTERVTRNGSELRVLRAA